jgi:hypothetical protein
MKNNPNINKHPGALKESKQCHGDMIAEGEPDVGTSKYFLDV